MHTTHSTPTSARPATADLHKQLRGFFLRKLWLPRIVYEILPYLYIAVGLLTLVAATKVPGWTWVLPYIALLGLLGIHAGLAITVIRYRVRNGRKKTN
jgi:hypothetical protein